MFDKDKRIIMGVAFGLSLMALGGCALMTVPPQQATKTQYVQTEKIQKTDSSIISDFVPQYKDNNNVCGLAKDGEGNIVAIASEDVCPASEILKNKFGYTYTLLTDNYSPANDGGFCGYAHYEKAENRLGKSDLTQLIDKVGDLTMVPVETENTKCPTLVELSNFITNSVGVPVRFKYNELNINTANYPVVVINNKDYLEDINVNETKDYPLFGDYGVGDERKLDKNGSAIARILQNSEALEFCKGDYKNCTFSSENMTLKNEEGKEYFLETHNGYALPKFLMTKGAWDACTGDFRQCDFIPDEEIHNSGKLVNVITGAEYHSVIPIEVTEN